MRRAAILAALAAVALCGCRSAPQPAPRPHAPAPRIDLAGQAVVHRVAGPADVPYGPGAEGREGTGSWRTPSSASSSRA